MYRRFFVFMLTAPILLITFVASLTMPKTVAGATDLISTPSVQLGSTIEVSWFDAEQYLPTVTYNSNLQEFFVVWHSKGTDNGHRRLFATRLNINGEIVSQFVIAYSPTANDRTQASVAYDPINRKYLVVWTEDVNGDGSNWDIYGALVPENFVSQTITPFAINEFPTSQWNPQVVYASETQEFLVVWTNTYSAGTPPAYISGRRVLPNGTFPSSSSDLTIFDTVENQVNPTVVYNGIRNEYLVVWEKVGSEHDVYGLRLTSTVNPINSEFAIAGWPGIEEQPSVAYCAGPDQYLVAWQAVPGGSGYDLYGRVVSGDGIPGQVSAIYSSIVDEKEPSVACDTAGQHYMVTWQQQYSSLSGPHGIWGRPVNSDMSLGDPLALVTALPGQVVGQEQPFNAAGGTGYFVAWQQEIGANVGHGIYGRFIHNSTVYLPFVIQ